jgi:hypothetical protein
VVPIRAAVAATSLGHGAIAEYSRRYPPPEELLAEIRDLLAERADRDAVYYDEEEFGADIYPTGRHHAAPGPHAMR